MAGYRYKDQNGNHKMRVKNSNDSYQADKYTFTGKGKHEHRNVSVNKSNGRTREYFGGDNSSQRSYNKKTSSSGK